MLIKIFANKISEKQFMANECIVEMKLSLFFFGIVDEIAKLNGSNCTLSIYTAFPIFFLCSQMAIMKHINLYAFW